MSDATGAESGGRSAKTFITAFNSTVIYLLTYLLLQGLYQAATVRMARRLGIPGTWHVSSITFSITDAEWWRLAVLAVYGIGPAVCAVVGLLAALWFWQRARLQRGLLKLVLLWTALHACNLVLGALVGDTFVENWAWYIPSWLFLAGNGPNVALAVVAALLQLAIGYFAAVAFLQSHDSITLMQYSNRPQLIRAGILAPWVVGSLVLTALKWPELSRNELFHFLTMGLLLVPMALHSAREPFDLTLPKSQKTRLSWTLLVVALVLAAAWRVMLAPGLQF
ncbi:hypothetical protein [Hymenobacter persicinus]|uniref:Uncharacterized protein n=1 Tax=Hymenobacter persicinus TaxID=2025506 RepID=A0A4Q5LGD7_9BACT|nr:hypothetical protein [Hymenobacter persicinus]RYU80464.1 hypothetical protein EWM57_08190 [Hymenobacter persicinus]